MCLLHSSVRPVKGQIGHISSPGGSTGAAVAAGAGTGLAAGAGAGTGAGAAAGAAVAAGAGTGLAAGAGAGTGPADGGFSNLFTRFLRSSKSDSEAPRRSKIVSSRKSDATRFALLDEVKYPDVAVRFRTFTVAEYSV